MTAAATRQRKSSSKKSYDIDTVRRAAASRWAEILSCLAGIDRSILDGKHHPCPKCGGTDRFRVFDNFDQTGGAICNQCLPEKNGDGFAIFQWLLEIDFGAALRKIAEYLGVSPVHSNHHNSNGKKEKADPAEHLSFFPWDETTELQTKMWAALHKPGVSLEAVQAVGGRMARYRDQYTVIALPVYGPKLTNGEPVGWHLYNHTGGPLPTFRKGEPIQWVKSKLTAGSSPGLMGEVDKLAAALNQGADLSVDPNAEPNAQTKTTIWKLEGPSDVLAFITAAKDHVPADNLPALPPHHIAITNANGAGEKPLSWVVELFLSRDARIVHDADKPGQDGAAKFAKAIAPAADDCRNIVLPYEIQPTHGKDLRDYFAVDGHSFADLLDLADASPPVERPGPGNSDALSGQDSSNNNALDEDDRDPHRLARIFLDGKGTYRFWREIFMRFDGGCYRLVPKAEMSATINAVCKAEFDRLARLKPPNEEGRRVPNTVSRALVNNVLAALEAICLLPDAVEPNTWLGAESDPLGFPAGQKLWISMTNGILRLDDLLADREGEDEISDVMHPHDPLWFSPIALPYDFEPDAKCPIFTSILEHNQEGDVERISLLQEWAGYVLTPTTHLQKFMVLEGEGANGKSVYMAVLQALVGEQNVSSIPLESFDRPFDLTQTLGKLLNVAADASEIEKAAEGRVKSFVSGDTMFFDRKGISGIQAQPTARLIVSANNLPRFSDRSSGIWRRMMVVPWNRKIADDDPKRILGADDPKWWEKTKELPGVFWWAVQGLARLQEQKKFTVPEACRDALENYRTESNPARAFLLEYYEECEVTEKIESSTSAKAIHEQYKTWCKDGGYHPLSDKVFGREIRRAFTKAERRQKSKDNVREWRVFGVLPRKTPDTDF